MTLQQLSIVIVSFIFITACEQTNEQLFDNGYNLMEQKKFAEAVSTYDEVIKRNGKLQLAYYNRGLAYMGIRNYDQALADFNKIMDLQTIGQFTITYNQDSPFASEEARTQVPYNDALYQRAQVKYYMDSLLSSFTDFQTLVDRGYEEKSNCMLWQGTIYVRSGNSKRACEYFSQAGQSALTDDDREEADEMKRTYCGQAK